MSQLARGKQPAQESVPQFDDAAFERAFAAVEDTQNFQEDAESSRSLQLRQRPVSEELLKQDSSYQDPIMDQLRETRPGE